MGTRITGTRIENKTKTKHSGIFESKGLAGRSMPAVCGAKGSCDRYDRPRTARKAKRREKTRRIAFASSFDVPSNRVLCSVIDMRLFSKKIATLCLLLTFWSALAFAAHHHSNGVESAKCSVCLAVHSASPKATSSLQKATFVAVSVCKLAPVSAKQRLVAFALSVRPPPNV
jgi:hypothetical protein